MSCSTRKHFFLFNQMTCLLVEEHMSSCLTGRHVFLLNKTCLLAEQETCLPVDTQRNVFLLKKKKKTCLLVDMSSCWRRRHVFLLNKKTCLLAEQKHPVLNTILMEFHLGSSPACIGTFQDLFRSLCGQWHPFVSPCIQCLNSIVHTSFTGYLGSHTEPSSKDLERPLCVLIESVLLATLKMVEL